MPEGQRLRALYEHHILDTPAEAAFDRFVRAAQEICQTPIALISLVDEQRQWFKARVGLDASETPRDISFCTHAIEQSDLFVVTDAQADARFADNPLVTADPHIRFYAGMPLKTVEGYAVGTLCVIDHQPRELTPRQVHALKDLARQVSVELQRRRAIAQLIHKPANGNKGENRFLRKLIVRFGLMTALTVGIQAATHWGNIRLLASKNWVTHTLEVISDIETVNAELANLRSATQEFVISGNPEALSNVDPSTSTIQQQFQELRRLTRDNAYQQQNLDQLEPLVNQELTYLKRMVAARQTSGFASVTPILQDEDRRILYPVLRSRLNQMRQEEEKLLTQRLTQAESNQKTAALVSTVGRIVVLGVILTTFGMVRQEIQRRRAAEADKEEQRELLEITLSSIGDGVVVTDCDRRVLSLNLVAEALTGWPEAAAKSRPVDDILQLVNLDTGEPVTGPFENALSTRNVQSLADGIGLRHRDGTTIPIDDSCAPIFSKEGNLRGVVMVFRDATPRVQAEAEMENALEGEKELNELKSNFISMVSHDIRTPLTTILTSIELLQHYIHKTTEEQRERYFNRIRNAIQQMQELLNDVLLFSEVGSNALKYEPAPLNLSEFCLDLIEEIQLSTGNSHEVVFFNRSCHQTVQMDAKILHHILANLLSNAVKYSPNQSKVYLDLECESDRVHFLVRDEGMGIPEDDIPKLFSAFHRASNVGRISGTGLGLSIVKNCVELHQGQITVTSQLGQGTTFKVTLPNHPV